MKKILISIFSISILFACSKDDNNAVKELEESTSYTVSYKNQPAQGKIKGVAFEYITGTFVQDRSNSDKFKVELFDKATFDTVGVDKMCGIGFYGTTRESYFSIPKQIGTYDLGGDFYATFKTGELNTALPAARKGAVEIISITETEMVGKIDAFVDESTFINGDFTVEFCSE